MADNEDPFARRRANRNIHIERRNRSPLPWLVGALLLVVLAVVFWPERAGRSGAGYAMPDAGGSVVTDPEMRPADVDAAIGDFARFVSSRRPRDVIGPKHEYTVEGIRRLATAISALAVRDTVAGRALEPRIQALRDRADALQRDPNADTHALKTREAFLLAASVLESIQDRRFRNLDGDATAVLRAAEAVRVAQPLTEQADAVERFFERSSHLLRAMASAGP
jgi:hypothetical protein